MNYIEFRPEQHFSVYEAICLDVVIRTCNVIPFLMNLLMLLCGDGDCGMDGKETARSETKENLNIPRHKMFP